MKYIYSLLALSCISFFSCEFISGERKSPKNLNSNIYDSLNNFSDGDNIKNNTIENLRIVKGFRGFKLGLPLDLFEKDSSMVPSPNFYVIQKLKISSNIFKIIFEDYDVKVHLYFYKRKLVRILVSSNLSDINYYDPYSKFLSIDAYAKIFGKPINHKTDHFKNKDKLVEKGIIPGIKERIKRVDVWRIDSIKFTYENIKTTYYNFLPSGPSNQVRKNWEWDDTLLFTLEIDNLQSKILNEINLLKKKEQIYLDSINKVSEFKRNKAKL